MLMKVAEGHGRDSSSEPPFQELGAVLAMTEAGASTSSAPFDFDNIDVGAEMGSLSSISPLPIAGPVTSETDANDTVASLAVEPSS